ncbi:MAG: pyridoxal-phosphate dependent enzyme [Sphingomonas sp.]|uniref:pyridoxal-phosphate dependent enzyme n=1 Tax=Sphingomonas sp. TaxID=28214 RepID=UPI001B12416C|nr:pyridoxal-phosphate dependent enzyme [Sphingomonas sp.]MBO9621572.1 pyridoxal-phosphate dependent enzyme [Sphingomonas sp.]
MTSLSFSPSGLRLPPTSLRDLPALAGRAGVSRVLVKFENERPLGNFKVLGGMYAGLRLLADHAGLAVPELADGCGAGRVLPRLICASDGNHGLSVAAAAQAAGSQATIYLHTGVDAARAERIARLGASIAWVPGTYDDAVDAAVAAERAGEGLLVPDTTRDAENRAVTLVMEGYAVLTTELRAQLARMDARLSHSFVQAGVGGLAAAVASGLGVDGGAMIVVEPESAACVGRALAAGRPELLPGGLATSAEMLSCGLASAPALEVLKRHGARPVAVGEGCLAQAVEVLAADAGVETTASGAAGLAGLLHVAMDPALRHIHRLGRDSIALVIVTEGACDPGDEALLA